ncbi:hypothetical protein ABZ816_34810 [Actinosynnema sp. NPDC047251]|uniref:Uncharacterized protein n=1 Tax=Saccharothrix espanaensis (strain ATCC 51144 / DSM 44229 / JCM 9112 / NBRC 15066 / NRRL 15764) TaxID=1179773 RepID=K0JPF8_SACES|nr:hypothetical protein [Saccharothrix espanaensis]CCH28625.1 hypothetical protein BN6_12990 [Saccharothrix espanaensis DSM 44229]
MNGRPERPWAPGPNVPFDYVLASPAGINHLAFDHRTGIWHRLHENGSAEPLHVGQAILLRPSDVDSILTFSMSWCLGAGHGKPRSEELVDELANSIGVLVRHLAERAGVPKA